MERYRNRIFHLSAPFNNSPLFNKNLEENIGSKKNSMKNELSWLELRTKDGTIFSFECL